MNTKNFNALIQFNRDHHTEMLKEAQMRQLLNQSLIQGQRRGMKWMLAVVLLITIFTALS